jgi:hypothetical protein
MKQKRYSRHWIVTIARVLLALIHGRLTLPGPTEMTSTGFWTEVTQLQGWSLINFGLERTPQIWRAVERLYTISRENYARAPQAL